MNKEDKKIDEISGIETTGHDWDGIKELNNPAPRWWLLIFFITIIWAIGYWIIYPAWPTISGEGERGGTRGIAGWTQENQLKEQLDITAKKRKVYLQEFQKSSFKQIMNDNKLYQFALVGGELAFKENCAACHGVGGGGFKGYPNLNDDDWLWGGTLEEIQKTIILGIRANNTTARNSVMPAFATFLKKEDLEDITKYVISLSNNTLYPEKGETLYKQYCTACHGVDGGGNKILGAPNLKDQIWLYADDINSIESQIANPDMGIMPAWQDRLSEDTIRQLTLYVHSLGGGVQ